MLQRDDLVDHYWQIFGALAQSEFRLSLQAHADARHDGMGFVVISVGDGFQLWKSQLAASVIPHPGCRFGGQPLPPPRCVRCTGLRREWEAEVSSEQKPKAQQHLLGVGFEGIGAGGGGTAAVVLEV